MNKIKLKDRVEFAYGFSVRVNSENVGDYPIYGSNGPTGYIDSFKVVGPGVIIGRKGSVGKIHFTSRNFTPTDTAYFLKIVDEKKDDLKFWYYYLSLLGLEKLNTHSSVPGLSREVAYLIQVDPPELVSQQKIASTLSTLDAKIELNNKINMELEGMVRVLYNYWFVQFDFPNEKGKPYKSSGGEMVWSDDLKRNIPKKWEVKELDDIISRSGTGLNPRDNFKLGSGDNYYITIKNVKGGKIIFDDTCDKVDNEALKIIDNRSDLQVGDILFTSIEPVGVTYFIHEKPKDWNINESVFTIRPNYEKVTSEFLYMLLSSDEMKTFTKNVSTGSIHKGVRHSVLKTFKLAYFDKKLIDDFSSIISPILFKINSINQENQKLVELRDWLLPMLMNGQISVK